MDKFVPRVTVWHHSTEPHNAKNTDPWDRFAHPNPESDKVTQKRRIEILVCSLIIV